MTYLNMKVVKLQVTEVVSFHCPKFVYIARRKTNQKKGNAIDHFFFQIKVVSTFCQISDLVFAHQHIYVMTKNKDRTAFYKDLYLDALYLLQ